MLNESRIRALKPEPRPYLVADSGGLSLKVSPSGHKAWVYRYRFEGKAEKLNLGPYPDLSLKDARSLHLEARRKVAMGQSPAGERKAARIAAAEGVTVADFANSWFSEYAPGTSANWQKTVRMWLDRDIIPALGQQRIADVTVKDLLRCLDKVKGRSESSARRVRVILRQVFAHAKLRQAIGSNPALEIPASFCGRSQSRARTLSRSELATYLKKVRNCGSSEAAKVALLVLAHTLCRKMEVVRARWTDVSFERGEWVIPAEHSKNGREHIVYLSTQVRDLLNTLKDSSPGSPWCFPSPLDPTKHLGRATLNHAINAAYTGDYRKRVTHTLHDIRRTGATMLCELGHPSDVVEKALNHAMPGVRGVYNRATYAAQRREMLQAWSDHLESLEGGATRVLPLVPERRAA